MGYSDGAMERGMKRQEVILKALSGEIHWFRAADILGMSVRTLRRYRAGLQKWGYEGLFRSPASESIAQERAGGGGEADFGVVSGAVPGLECPAFL
jgi:hypothetical protein